MSTARKTHIASEEGLNRIADAINGLAARQTLTYDSAKGRYDNASIKTWLAAQADGKAYGVSIPKSAATGCTKTGANSGIANPVPGIIRRVDPYSGALLELRRNEHDGRAFGLRHQAGRHVPPAQGHSSVRRCAAIYAVCQVSAFGGRIWCSEDSIRAADKALRILRFSYRPHQERHDGLFGEIRCR